MGMISELFVMFTTKGVDSVAAAGKKVQESMEKTNDVIKSIGSVATATFGAASASILAMAAAGVAASTTGQVLQFQMERLARTVAGLFGPEINKLIELIQRLTDWIDHLSNSQKKMIAFFTLAAAGIAIFLALLPAIISGVGSLIAGILGIAAAIKAALASTGVGSILPIIGYLIAGITAAVVACTAALGGFFAFTDVGNDLLKELADTVMPAVTEAWELLADIFAIVADVARAVLIPVLKVVVIILKEIVKEIREAINELRQFLGLPKHIDKGGDRGAMAGRMGGFEGVGDTWKRIAQSSVMAGQKVEQHKTIDDLYQLGFETKAVVAAVVAAIKAIKPNFGV